MTMMATSHILYSFRQNNINNKQNKLFLLTQRKKKDFAYRILYRQTIIIESYIEAVKFFMVLSPEAYLKTTL